MFEGGRPHTAENLELFFERRAVGLIADACDIMCCVCCVAFLPLGAEFHPTAFLACLQGDVRYLRDIEEFYTTQIEEMPMNVADLI